MKNNLKKIGLIMGSISDYEKMKPAIDLCEEMGVSYEAHVYSAHRTPEALNTFLTEGKEHLGVIIAAAGKAAHLPGMCAALTPLPVIGVPIKTSDLGGVDSLYSIVQMPGGIPVATVAINGAKNAGILATKILALSNEELFDKLEKFSDGMAKEVEAKDKRLKDVGVDTFLKG